MSPLHTYSWSQLLAMRGVASAIIGAGLKFLLLPSAHAHSIAGYCLHELRLYVL